MECSTPNFPHTTPPLRQRTPELSKRWLIQQGWGAKTRRKWNAKTKAMFVLEGLKVTPLGTSCPDFQISQVQYYQRDDQFLTNAPKTFEGARQTDPEARLQREPARLKSGS